MFFILPSIDVHITLKLQQQPTSMQVGKQNKLLIRKDEKVLTFLEDNNAKGNLSGL
jgi:hypothetical protein